MKKKTIKAWAILENGELLPQRCHEYCPEEYWVLAKKPKRKDYHKDFTFAQVEITYTSNSK